MSTISSSVTSIKWSPFCGSNEITYEESASHSSYSPLSSSWFSSWFSNDKPHESYKKKDGTRVWTYMNHPVEYQVTISDQKITINSVKNGKKREMTLIGEEAKKVRNFFEKMDLSTSPFKAIKPIAPLKPLKPLKPISFSFFDTLFDDRTHIQNKLYKEINASLEELHASLEEYQEMVADYYQTELANYEKEAKLHPSLKKEHEAARAQLITFLDKVLDSNA